MAELRIGTRERELAMAALDEHLRDGRLDATEYGDRSATASTARFRSELDALFDDLPAPHPAYPGGAAGAAAPPSGSPAPGPGRPGSTASADDDRTAPGATADRSPREERPAREEDLPELVAPLGARLGRHAGTLSVLAPVIAIALFAVTGFRFPQVFLLVPAAIAVLAWLGHRHGN